MFPMAKLDASHSNLSRHKLGHTKYLLPNSGACFTFYTDEKNLALTSVLIYDLMIIRKLFTFWVTLYSHKIERSSVPALP